MRERDGLPIILSCCQTDFKNPLIREWALLCVKNACENNPRNQAFINELKPQKVLQDEILQAQGITVHLDSTTGKVEFKQTLPSALQSNSK